MILFCNHNEDSIGISGSNYYNYMPAEHKNLQQDNFNGMWKSNKQWLYPCEVVVMVVVVVVVEAGAGSSSRSNKEEDLSLSTC